MLISRADEIFIDDLFVDLEPVLDVPLSLKCEGFNFGGSIKMKAASSMIDDAERSGLLGPGSILVESTSGNLGVAISIIAASRGYEFVCVTDARTNAVNRQIIEATGARVVVISDGGPDLDFLSRRLEYVRQLCLSDPRVVWLNQYANAENWRAHYRTTGPSIVKAFPDVETVYIGAGTAGTLMGCATYLHDVGHVARIVAVDSVGSLGFPGQSARPRYIPGLGSSRPLQMLDDSLVDEVVHVEETDTVRMCRRLIRSGYLFGGSTGTVLAGALQHRALTGVDARSPAVAIAPDLGERYLDTMYDDSWVTSASARASSACPTGGRPSADRGPVCRTPSACGTGTHDAHRGRLRRYGRCSPPSSRSAASRSPSSSCRVRTRSWCCGPACATAPGPASSSRSASCAGRSCGARWPGWASRSS